MIRREYLMTPGPTPLPPEVLLTQAEPMMHHRTPEYTELFVQLIANLKEIFLTKNEVLVFSASGTGAMEAAVANCFSPGDSVLVAHGGKFGERFRDIAKSYGLDVVEYAYEWGDVADPEVIGRMLKEKPWIKGVILTHSETSTGAVNDVKSVGEIVRETPAILIVDSISGVGALEMRTDEWGVDVLVCGSQKALMTPPGMAAVAVSPKAWELVEKSSLPKYYFSFSKARKSMSDKSPQTPFTPAVSLTKAMSVGAKLILEEGLENVWKRHQMLAMCTRSAVEALGLRLFTRNLERSYAVTAVNAPPGIDGTKIVRIMNRKHGVILAGGQSQLKGKIFRIGHVGYYSFFDIIVSISALELTLRELGYPVEMGTGVAAAEESYYEYINDK